MLSWLAAWTLASANETSGRLADPVRPTAQGVEIAIDPTQTTFEATTVLTLDVIEKISSFSLHAEELEIAEVTLGRPGRRARPAVFSAGEAQVRIDAGRKLKPGAWELRIRYEGQLHDQTYGLYRFEVDGVPYVASQFEADEARTAWPCFDEPSFKVPLSLAVTAPEGMAVIGNGPVASAAPGPALPDGRATTVTRLAPVGAIPSYAAALLVGPYVRAEIPGMPVPASVYTVAGHEAYAGLVRDAMPPTLAALEGWFGTPQPYPKIDLVVVPRFTYGAMENPGAIVAAEHFLPPADRATPEQAELAYHLIAHELAHFWFGDWVTMAWWDDLWLNESFAEWLGRKVTAEQHPEFRGEVGRVERMIEMLSHDAGSSAQPVRTEVDPRAVFETVNFAVYPKGEALLDMVEAHVGPEAFREGLRAYLAAHAWGNATASDLFLALSSASGVDVQQVMDASLDRPGAPWLRFEIDGPKVRITQQPLSQRGASPPSEGPWTVPLRLRLGRPGGPVETVTATLGPDGPLDLDLGEVSWLMPAADGIGYYAWSLPDEALDRLIGAADRLSVAERVQILSMLGLQHDAGERSLGDVITRSAAFASDDDPDVLRAVLDRVRGVGIADVIGDPTLSAAADAWLVSRLRPMLDRVGTAPVAGEPVERTELRVALLHVLARAGDPQVVSLGESIGLAAPGGEVAPELVSFGLRTLAEHTATPETTQQMLWEWAEAAPDPVSRSRFLEAYGLVVGRGALTAALERAYAPQTAPNDMFAIFSGVASRGREAEGDLVLELTMQHHEDVLAKTPPVWQPRLAEIGGGCSLARLEKAKAFYGAPERARPGTDTVLAEVAARVAACRARVEADEPSLRELLGTAGP